MAQATHAAPSGVPADTPALSIRAQRYIIAAMGLRERFEWLMRMALLVFILAAASFLSAITAIRFAIHGREVDMPNLVGKSARDAQALLGSRGLGVKVADRVFSDLPVGQVVRQSPPVGVHMKVSQQAHVVLSLGTRQVPIPGIEGKSIRAARIELLRASLQVGEVSSTFLAGIDTDAIVQQDPKPGGGTASPRVNLLVSAGIREPAYVMPFLVGLSQVEAMRELGTAGLRVSKLNFVLASQWPHGAVIEQWPPAGARVTPGSTLELQIAE